MRDERLIITAASAVFGERLLAWAGALSANWPSHPKILVYDLGLSPEVRSELVRHGIELRTVPPFCAHWRLHFTWKLWCWNDAPAGHVLWLDAGAVVLEPLEEVFLAIEHLGYFAIPNYRSLSAEASKAACSGCGLAHSFTRGRPSIAGTVFGFDKSKMRELITRSLEIAMTEEHIKATARQHRHDQAILSLLLHKAFDPVFLFDGRIYGSAFSPRQVPGQKIWVHRWRMRRDDLEALGRRIGCPGKFMPQEPSLRQKIRRQILLMRSVRFIRSIVPRSQARAIYDGVRD